MMAGELTMISVAKDFSRYPSGRYPQDSRFSGQRFREELIAPLLRLGNTIEIDLDGTLGYGSSFLDEAFGGLSRVCGFSRLFLLEHLRLLSKDKGLVQEAWSYVK